MSREMSTPTRVAFVTGAAGGIGRALTDRLTVTGWRVFGCDVTNAPPEGRHAGFLQADVTDEAAVERACAACLAALGRIDAVVHLAGRAGAGPLVDVSRAEWDQLLAVNLTSAFLVAGRCHAALAATRGTLVLMSSTNARNGGSALSGPAYAVAKAGIINLTRYLAREWAGEGIRVNCVAPGPVDTPMLRRLPAAIVDSLEDAIPLGRVATADEVAAVIAFLCSPDAAYQTGTVLNVSGGLVMD